MNAVEVADGKRSTSTRERWCFVPGERVDCHTVTRTNRTRIGLLEPIRPIRHHRVLFARRVASMPRSVLLAMTCGATLFAANRAWPEQPSREVDLNKLRPGMPQPEVRELLGPPKRIARQILYRRYLEQWVYDGPKPLRIEFQCVRGEEPKILTVHPLTPPQP